MTSLDSWMLRLGSGLTVAALLAVGGAADAQTHPGGAPAPHALPPPPAPPPAAATPVPPAPAAPVHAPPYPAAGVYGQPTVIPVEFASTEPGTAIEVYPRKAKVGRDAPIVRCDAPCRVNIVPGRYIVHVTESEETVKGSRSLDLRSPIRLTVDPDTHEHRDAGLAMGIAGPVLMVAGAIALATQMDSSEQGRWRDQNDTLVSLGFTGILGGAALTAVGWVMFGTSFKPEYEIQSIGVRVARGVRDRPPAPTWSLGPVPFVGGAGLGGQLLF